MIQRRNITKETFEKVIKSIPQKIISMLPESPEELLEYAKRVTQIQYSSKISEKVRKLMQEHLLNDEEYLKTFFYVMAISFYNKYPVDKPCINIVAAQTGSGKSNLTAKLLRENENYVFVDSDKYKHFRYDARDIAQNFQVLYPSLTGPDAYDHASNIYEYAISHKYNVIKETAPSPNKGLLELSKKEVLDNGYKIFVNVLSVGKLNSLLSIHERYELQIINKLKTAKLTPIARHNESYDALIENVNEILEDKDISSIKIYSRGIKEENFDPILVYPSDKYTNPIIAIEDTRNIDNDKTISEFAIRYGWINENMQKRNAPEEQVLQLNLIKKIKENIV